MAMCRPLIEEERWKYFEDCVWMESIKNDQTLRMSKLGKTGME